MSPISCEGRDIGRASVMDTWRARRRLRGRYPRQDRPGLPRRAPGFPWRGETGADHCAERTSPGCQRRRSSSGQPPTHSPRTPAPLVRPPSLLEAPELEYLPDCLLIIEEPRLFGHDPALGRAIRDALDDKRGWPELAETPRAENSGDRCPLLPEERELRCPGRLSSEHLGAALISGSHRANPDPSCGALPLPTRLAMITPPGRRARRRRGGGNVRRPRYRSDGCATRSRINGTSFSELNLRGGAIWAAPGAAGAAGR